MDKLTFSLARCHVVPGVTVFFCIMDKRLITIKFNDKMDGMDRPPDNSVCGRDLWKIQYSYS